MAITPRGGSHRLFRQPAGKHWRCTEGRLAPKVDTRADGGYIVAPPSVVEGVGAYQWVEGLELDAPPETPPRTAPLVGRGARPVGSDRRAVLLGVRRTRARSPVAC